MFNFYHSGSTPIRLRAVFMAFGLKMPIKRPFPQITLETGNSCQMSTIWPYFSPYKAFT